LPSLVHVKGFVIWLLGKMLTLAAGGAA